MGINQFNCWTKDHIINDFKFDENSFIITENDANHKSIGAIISFFKTLEFMLF